MLLQPLFPDHLDENNYLAHPVTSWKQHIWESIWCLSGSYWLNLRAPGARQRAPPRQTSGEASVKRSVCNPRSWAKGCLRAPAGDRRWLLRDRAVGRQPMASVLLEGWWGEERREAIGLCREPTKWGLISGGFLDEVYACMEPSVL